MNFGQFMQKHIAKMWPETTFPVTDLFFREEGGEFPIKAGLELFIDAPDAEFDEKLQFRFDIAISEPQILEAQSLIETLNQMANLVEGIIATLEPKLR